MHRFSAIVSGLSLLVFVTACGPTDPTPPQASEASQTNPNAQASTQAAPRVFQVRGVIKEIPDTGTSLRIHHEEIPDYMPAMTMPFNVKDRAEFAHVKVDDQVSFTLHVTDTESWIDQIQSTASGITPGQIPSVSSFRQVRDVEALKIGDPMPNYPFTDHNSKAIQLDDFRGKVLVMTFIYTRCPIPDFCPRMSMHFRSAYETLRKDSDAPANWHFLSISFDPEFDTPEVLRNYSKAYSYDSSHWTFATGEMIEIDAITEQFGLMFSRSKETLTDWDHNLRTVMIDPHGIIYKIYVGNTWTPDELVHDLKQASLLPAPESDNAAAAPTEDPE